MQRAVSVSKLLASNHVTRIKEAEISRLHDLLPHGLNTVLHVDILRLLAKGKSPRYCLNIPTTLLSTHQTPPFVLINTSEEGLIHCTSLENPSQALNSFQVSLKNSPPKPNFPSFTHKTDHKQVTFHFDIDQIPVLFSQFSDFPQTLQQYIPPPSSSLSLLRTHWKIGHKRPIYYIITKEMTKKERFRRNESLPSLTKLLSEFRKSEKTGNLSQNYAVSGKLSGECWVVKQKKPLPEVDLMVKTVRKIVENAELKQNQSLTELVCDFVSNIDRKWVFLRCKGYTFTGNTRIMSQTLEAKRGIDIKYILFPLFDRKEILGRRIRAANQMEDSGLNTYERRISILGMGELKRQQADKKKQLQPVEPARRISFLHTPPEDPNPAYSEVIKRYDDIIKSIHRHKQELPGKVDFYEKYGGNEFWSHPLTTFHLYLTMESGLRFFSIHMNMEESRMMKKGYEQVLKGNYGIHFRHAIRRIHENLGVTTEEYRLFLLGMEKELLGVQVEITDCNIILRRFRSFEHEICRPARVVK